MSRLMRTMGLILLALLASTLLAGATPEPDSPLKRTVSADLREADLVYAIKLLCFQARLESYVDLGVQGSVTITAAQRPLGEVLRSMLANCPDLGFRMSAGRLYVAPRNRLYLVLPGPPKRMAAPVELIRPVSAHFEEADLGTAIRELCRLGGLNLYAAPSLCGQVTLEVHDVPLGVALRRLLSVDPELEFAGVDDDTIVVAPRHELDRIMACIRAPKTAKTFHLFLLEHAPAAKVVEFLQSRYDEVRFLPHPTRNGFYAIGSKRDLLKIKAELPGLDVEPLPPAEP